MSGKKVVMAGIVILCLIVYIYGMVVIASASLAATPQKPATVHENWVNVVAGLTSVLALNAGAYLGLKEGRFRFDVSDPETARMIATIIYFVTIVASFFVATTAQSPHPQLTDMGGTLVGFLVGVLSVWLGRD